MLLRNRVKAPQMDNFDILDRVNVRYCTPIIFLDNYNLLALSCLEVLGESLFAVVAICYLGSRKKKLLVASLYSAAIVFVTTVVTVACFLLEEIHVRGKLVSTIMTCFSFITVLATGGGVRSVVFKKDTAAELSVFSSVLGASGSLNLCLYGVLFHNKIIAIHYAVAFVGRVTILVVIGALYLSHHRRYRVGFSTILLVLRSTYWEYVRSKIPRAFVARLALPAPPRPDVESSGRVEVELGTAPTPEPDINEAPVTMESLGREMANLRELEGGGSQDQGSRFHPRYGATIDLRASSTPPPSPYDRVGD
ncbi:unnamed protein product [Linum trigynum]|uniref:Uncharacterized protein n=1 Tax=Linum trigynum TaxID=586398 RepID=A0AAV2G9Q6_9ROSI